MWSTLGGWLAPLTLCLGSAVVDDPSESQAHKAFATRAANFSIHEKNTGVDLVLREQSLLNWGNPARQQERGSVFAWLSDGRPRVIGSFFTYQLGEAVRDKLEFHSLSEDPLIATYDGETVWTPNGNAITWRPLDDAPTLGGNEQKRLVQMRMQARRFSAVLVSPSGERDELRLMTQPLLRYAAPKAKVLDGAIFSFVVATDPEVLLLIEAAGPPNEEKWRYALARFHYWELAARLDDRPVWSVAADLSQATHQVGDPSQMTKPYVSFHPK